MRDAADISQRLARCMPALAAELLPAGRREGREWRCGSVAGEAGGSLSVCLSGAKAGVWSDFASGESGDALDLVAAILYRGDKVPALAWSRRWLGLAGVAPPAAQRAPARPARDLADADADSRRRAALRLFLEAQEGLAGTPVAAYLAGRGIDLAELGRQPRSLRFHPALPNRESGRAWPAMVAAVTNPAGEHAATHRTWLAQDAAGAWCKAPLRAAKMSLGSIAGGAIRLWRGQSGKALANAPAGETVAIAEGIETALSVVIACPELRVLSAVSLSNMGTIVLPPAIATVILCADNDGEDTPAAQALQRAAQSHLAQGRKVRIARPPVGKDFNDVLQAASA